MDDANLQMQNANEDQVQEQFDEQTQEPKTFDTEYVKKLRAEAARYRKERNELEAKVKAFEQERMTKEEQAAQKLKELEEREKALTERMRSSNLRAAIMTAGAGKLASVDAAMKLLDANTIEFDEDNNPVGVEAAVAKLLKEYPFLGVQMPPSGDKTNPERGGRNALTLDDIKRMSPSEINARWEEVSAVMSKK
jgi:hypothetical protein